MFAFFFFLSQKAARFHAEVEYVRNIINPLDFLHVRDRLALTL
jgi:hypothetical protein